jgi:RNA polymerase sigma factor (TIGR02999 family)
MREGNETERAQLTRFLNELAQGRSAAAEGLMPYVHAQLRELARTALLGQAERHTLQPTALVHEAFLRLFPGQDRQWNDRRHFFALAAKAMRQIRHRAPSGVQRGGGNVRVTRPPREAVAPATESWI